MSEVLRKMIRVTLNVLCLVALGWLASESRALAQPQCDQCPAWDEGQYRGCFSPCQTFTFYSAGGQVAHCRYDSQSGYYWEF